MRIIGQFVLYLFLKKLLTIFSDMKHDVVNKWNKNFLSNKLFCKSLFLEGNIKFNSF